MIDAMIKTKRLNIYPASNEKLKWLIENETDQQLKQAYEEILGNCLSHPQEKIWYALWLMELPADKKIVGSICFKGIDKNGAIEIGYGTNKKYQGNGYMSEAVSAIVNWLSNQKEVLQIEAETDFDNIASQKILKKCGFVQDKIMGKEGLRFIWHST